MKNWKKIIAGFITGSVLTATLTLPDIADAAPVDQTGTVRTGYKTGTIVPASHSEAVRLAAKKKFLSEYYITSGKKLKKIVTLLEGLTQEKTGLDASQSYFFRMDKALTGKYFYHIKAFAPDMETLVGEYLIAKDYSCVFRRFPADNSIRLLEGTTDKLLKKVEIMPANAVIPLKSSGKVIARVPGGLPYNLTLTSLTENIATITEENGQPVILGNVRGHADILAEVEIGGYVKSEKLRFAVMDERDIAAYEARRTYVPMPIFIGPAWGWWDRYPGPPPGPRPGPRPRPGSKPNTGARHHGAHR